MKIKTKKSEKPAKSTKRTTSSIYKKKTVRVRGFVDRISNGIVVVVISSLNEKDTIEEIYIPVSKFPKGAPDEGDYICVTIER